VTISGTVPRRPGRAGLGIGLAAVARPADITTGRSADLGGRRGVADLRERTFAVLDAAYAVIVKEAVANGRLTPGEPLDSEPVRRAAAVAAELGLGLDQLATAAALAQPWAWRVLSGAVTVEQLDSNVAAEKITLPPGVLDELATLAEPAGEYWAARSRRPWA
jgi:hypothetical protein